jgi:hypothetical protein
MHYDYQQTQAEITYQLVGHGDWTLKKVALIGFTDAGAGRENALFDAHRIEMNDAGWALVSMAAIAGTLQQTSASAAERSQTSNYELFWKRRKGKADTPSLTSIHSAIPL